MMRSWPILFGLVFLLGCSAGPTSVPKDLSPETTLQAPMDDLQATIEWVPTATSTPTTTSSPIPTSTFTVTRDFGLYMRQETGLTDLVRLVYSEDGRYLFAADVDGTISAWDMTTVEQLGKFETANLVDFLLSPDGLRLAVISEESIQLWDVGNAHNLAEYPRVDGDNLAVSFIPSGELAITGIVNEIQATLTYLPSGEQKTFLTPDVEFVLLKAAALAPNGKLFALGGSDGVIRLYDVSNGALLRNIEAHFDWVISLAFSPDSQLLASGSFSFDPFVKVWKVENGTLVSTPKDDKWDLGRLFFSPDGGLFIVENFDGTEGWQTSDWSPHPVQALAQFSPDGVLMAASDGEEIGVWQVQNAAFVQSFPSRSLSAVALAPTEPQPLIALGLPNGVIEIRKLVLQDGNE